MANKLVSQVTTFKLAGEAFEEGRVRTVTFDSKEYEHTQRRMHYLGASSVQDAYETATTVV
jgi:hypothetical protein